MYGWSITHCLPAAMAEQPSDADRHGHPGGHRTQAGRRRRLRIRRGARRGRRVLPHLRAASLTDGPRHRGLGPVRTPRTGPDRVLQMPGQLWMHPAQIPDRGPDPPAHRRPSPLGRRPGRAGASGQPEGLRELLDQRVELVPRRARPARCRPSPWPRRCRTAGRGSVARTPVGPARPAPARDWRRRRCPRRARGNAPPAAGGTAGSPGRAVPCCPGPGWSFRPRTPPRSRPPIPGPPPASCTDAAGAVASGDFRVPASGGGSPISPTRAWAVRAWAAYSSALGPPQEDGEQGQVPGDRSGERCPDAFHAEPVRVGTEVCVQPLGHLVGSDRHRDLGELGGLRQPLRIPNPVGQTRMQPLDEQRAGSSPGPR